VYNGTESNSLEVTNLAIHIVLYQPQIPSNTGNIARTCAGTDTVLHLIRPFGFSMEDKALKRAGLDYWEFVKIYYYDSLEEFYDKNEGGAFYYVTKAGESPYDSFDYSTLNKEHYFIFGSETTGLPEEVIQNNVNKTLRIPMTDNILSYNLSNTAAVLIYEALRQQNFAHLK
jgi:tRNA (cytidine/uridine-2'-O-)-methyltransferase